LSCPVPDIALARKGTLQAAFAEVVSTRCSKRGSQHLATDIATKLCKND